MTSKKITKKKTEHKTIKCHISRLKKRRRGKYWTEKRRWRWTESYCFIFVFSSPVFLFKSSNFSNNLCTFRLPEFNWWNGPQSTRRFSLAHSLSHFSFAFAWRQPTEKGISACECVSFCFFSSFSSREDEKERTKQREKELTEVNWIESNRDESSLFTTHELSEQLKAKKEEENEWKTSPPRRPRQRKRERERTDEAF